MIIQIIVYRKGDIVKQPMTEGSFVPKNVPGVGWGGVGHEGVGCSGVEWGRVGGVGHEGVGWVMQGWGGSHRGGVGHAGVGWVM